MQVLRLRGVMEVHRQRSSPPRLVNYLILFIASVFNHPCLFYNTQVSRLRGATEEPSATFFATKNSEPSDSTYHPWQRSSSGTLLFFDENFDQVQRTIR